VLVISIAYATKPRMRQTGQGDVQTEYSAAVNHLGFGSAIAQDLRMRGFVAYTSDTNELK